MKPKKFTILILIAIILTLLVVVFTRERQHINTLIYYKEAEALKEEARIENLNKFTENYNELYKSYNELYTKYEKLASENGFYQGWELYQVTAYTSLDDGCNDFAATGININQMSKYFNFCAVDNSIVPYGSVVLVKFDTGIEGFLSVDCGDAIKGKHIDLYFVNDLSNAFEFGNRELEVKIIQ